MYGYGTVLDMIAWWCE